MDGVRWVRALTHYGWGPSGTRNVWLWMARNRSGWLQMLPDGFKLLRMVPDGYGWLPEVPSWPLVGH